MFGSSIELAEPPHSPLTGTAKAKRIWCSKSERPTADLGPGLGRVAAQEYVRKVRKSVNRLLFLVSLARFISLVHQLSIQPINL